MVHGCRYDLSTVIPAWNRLEQEVKTIACGTKLLPLHLSEQGEIDAGGMEPRAVTFHTYT